MQLASPRQAHDSCSGEGNRRESFSPVIELKKASMDSRNKLPHPRRGFWIRPPSPAARALPRVPITGYMSPTTSAPQFETHYTQEPRSRMRLLGTPLPIAEQISRSAHQGTASSVYGRACSMGGALVGRPRQARIFRIGSGAFIAASILILAPHRGQTRTSNSKTRAISWAHG